nr:hypothetical protein [Tanacetum cinerariifolium]
GGSKDSRKLAWVKWSNILASLDKGGLAVDSLWVHVIKSIHGGEARINIRGCQTNKSRAVNVGRSKAELDALILDIANLETNEGVDSDSCIWSLSHDNNFSVNSARKPIDDVTPPKWVAAEYWVRGVLLHRSTTQDIY